MKTIITIALAAAALAAQTPKAELTVRAVKEDGTVFVARITGPIAAQGQQIAEAFMATQTECKPVAAVPEVRNEAGEVTTPAVPASQTCTPMYTDIADFGLKHLFNVVRDLSNRGFTSAALDAEEKDVAARTKALAAKKEDFFKEARKKKESQ